MGDLLTAPAFRSGDDGQMTRGAWLRRCLDLWLPKVIRRKADALAGSPSLRPDAIWPRLSSSNAHSSGAPQTRGSAGRWPASWNPSVTDRRISEVGWRCRRRCRGYANTLLTAAIEFVAQHRVITGSGVRWRNDDLCCRQLFEISPPQAIVMPATASGIMAAHAAAHLGQRRVAWTVARPGGCCRRSGGSAPWHHRGDRTGRSTAGRRPAYVRG